MRDQRKAIVALAAAEREAGSPVGSESAEATAGTEPAASGTGQPEVTVAAGTAAAELKTAAIERGRIASMSGVVALIWLAMIVLMVWNGR